jgi:hypothetical protein
LRVTELPAWAWMSGPPSILTTGTTIRIMGHSLIFKLAAGSSKWRRKGQEISECKYEVVALPIIWTKKFVKFCPCAPFSRYYVITLSLLSRRKRQFCLLWVKKQHFFTLSIYVTPFRRNQKSGHAGTDSWSWILRTEFFKNFRSYFGQCDDFIFLFWNFLTFTTRHGRLLHAKSSVLNTVKHFYNEIIIGKHNIINKTGSNNQDIFLI